VENFFKVLGKNIIEDVGMADLNNLFKKIMNKLEVIPELKERCWIEGEYVLTTPENYKLITLYRLYEQIFHYNQFEKDNDMANLYVKYKIVVYRGEDTTKIYKKKLIQLIKKCIISIRIKIALRKYKKIIKILIKFYLCK
jgi:hypothetical protein